MPTPCLVTGSLRTLLGGSATFGSVVFTLTNLGVGTVPRVIGTGIFPALTQTVQADENGNVSTNLWGNDNIDPANTLYLVTFRDSNKNEVGTVLFLINGTNFNLNTAVAQSVILPPVMTQPGNINRIQAVLGSPLVLGDFAFSGWGTGATLTAIVGTDTMFQLLVTAGTTPSSNPTITLTFHDGAWLLAPLSLPKMTNGTGQFSDIEYTTTTTQLLLTYLGLPVATKTYQITALQVGHP